MKRPVRQAATRGAYLRVILAVLLLGAVSCGVQAEPVPVHPPAGWLAVLHTSSLTATRELARWNHEVFGSSGANTLAVIDMLLSRYDKEAVGDGPVALGAIADESGEPALFVLLTPPSFDGLIEEIDAEKIGGIAVLDSFGVTLSPFGQHTLVMLSSDAQRVGQPRIDTNPLPAAGDLCFSASQPGFAWMAAWAAESTPGRRLAARRLQRVAWQWPLNLNQFQAVFGFNEPLWRQLEQDYTAGHFFVERTGSPSESLSTTLVLERAVTSSELAAAPAAALAGEPQGIFSVRGNSAAGYLPNLISLLTAYQRGRPDQVRARAYNAEAFNQYEKKLQAAAALVSGFDLQQLEPGDDLPLEANHVAVLDTSDPSALVESIADVAAAWNELIEASGAADRVLFEQRPFEQEKLRGIELRADLVLAAGPGVKDTPEMRALLAGFVGNEGWWTIRLAELPDGRVLVSEAPLKTAIESARAGDLAPDRPAAAESRAGGAVDGFWRLHRHAAWRAELSRVQNLNTLGWKESKPMRAVPPIAIGLQADSHQIRVEIQSPGKTLRALGNYLNE